MKKAITILVLLLTITTTQAQKKNAKITLEVEGVCMMCKNRIEKNALTTKGVKYANWDLETQQLTMIIDERKTSKKAVCVVLAKAGHDSAEIRATQEAYDSLHPCCKYRDEEIIQGHKEQ